MDEEIYSGFGGPQTGQDTHQQAATKEEMARRMQDRIRVCNITDSDFIIQWDIAHSGGSFIIPAKTRDVGYGPGQYVLPRYLAINYIKKMQDEILGQRLFSAVQAAIKERIDRGQPKPNHYEERLQIESSYRTDNKEMRDALIPYLWLGVEEEYGMQLQPSTTNEDIKRREELAAQLNRPAQRQDSVTVDPMAIVGGVSTPDLPTSDPIPQVTLPVTPPPVTPAPPVPSPVDQLLSSIEAKP